MGFKDDYDFDLIINEVRDLVIKEIEKQLKSEVHKDICRCQDCILDIAALSMNHLKPAYRSSLSIKGLMYKQSNLEKYNIAVEKVVSDAFKQVSKNRSH